MFITGIIFTVIDIVPLVAVTILVGLHIYLIINKKTTISLIKENRKKNGILPQNHEEEQTPTPDYQTFQALFKENLKKKKENRNSLKPNE